MVIFGLSGALAEGMEALAENKPVSDDLTPAEFYLGYGYGGLYRPYPFGFGYGLYGGLGLGYPFYRPLIVG